MRRSTVIITGITTLVFLWAIKRHNHATTLGVVDGHNIDQLTQPATQPPSVSTPLPASTFITKTGDYVVNQGDKVIQQMPDGAYVIESGSTYNSAYERQHPDLHILTHVQESVAAVIAPPIQIPPTLVVPPSQMLGSVSGGGWPVRPAQSSGLPSRVLGR